MTQFRKLAYPGDTVLIGAEDVVDLNGDPLTTGVTGSVTLYDRDTDAVVLATTPLDGNAGNSWWALTAAPAAGEYRAVVVIQTSSARLTLRGELQVVNPLD